MSGQGLADQYEYFSNQTLDVADARWVNREAEKGDAAAQRAMRSFVRIYGAYIGNLALLFKPAEGIYITGGMAPKMTQWMESEHFLNAFRDKGRMKGVVEQVSVRLVTNEKVGVLGAVAEAVRLLGEE